MADFGRLSRQSAAVGGDPEVIGAVAVVIGAIWHHVFVHSRRKIEFQNGYARKRDDLGVVFVTFSCTAVLKGQNRTAMHENVILGVCNVALAPAGGAAVRL